MFLILEIFNVMMHMFTLEITNIIVHALTAVMMHMFTLKITNIITHKPENTQKSAVRRAVEDLQHRLAPRKMTEAGFWTHLGAVIVSAKHPTIFELKRAAHVRKSINLNDKR